MILNDIKCLHKISQASTQQICLSLWVRLGSRLSKQIAHNHLPDKAHTVVLCIADAPFSTTLHKYESSSHKPWNLWVCCGMNIFKYWEPPIFKQHWLDMNIAKCLNYSADLASKTYLYFLSLLPRITNHGLETVEALWWNLFVIPSIWESLRWLQNLWNQRIVELRSPISWNLGFSRTAICFQLCCGWRLWKPSTYNFSVYHCIWIWISSKPPSLETIIYIYIYIMCIYIYIYSNMQHVVYVYNCIILYIYSIWSS